MKAKIIKFAIILSCIAAILEFQNCSGSAFKSVGAGLASSSLSSTSSAPNSPSATSQASSNANDEEVQIILGL